MKRVNVTVVNSTEDGRTEEQRAGWTTPTPGLVVVDPTPVSDWSITHERSGTVVCYADNPEQAIAIATHLHGVCDWTRPANEISTVENARRTEKVWGPLGGYLGNAPRDSNDPARYR